MIEKVWELLEKEGLSGLTPERLATYSEKAEVEIRTLYPTPLSILLLLWDDVVGRSVLQTLPDNPHDCLFESLMSVLEVLEPQRLPMKRLLDDLMTAPCWMKDILPYVLKWSRHVLQQAGFATTDFRGALKVHAFSLFFLYILKVWSTDESPGSDVTMMKLDQGLTKILSLEKKF